MPVTIEEIENDKLDEFLEFDSGNELTLLPINWKSDTEEIYESNTSTTIKLLRANKIPVKLLKKNQSELKYVENRSIDWVAPTIFMTGEFLSNHPIVTSVITGVLGNYIYEIFKGSKKPPNVKVNIIYKKDKKSTAKNITFEGDPSGLTELSKILDNLK